MPRPTNCRLVWPSCIWRKPNERRIPHPPGGSRRALHRLGRCRQPRTTGRAGRTARRADLPRAGGGNRCRYRSQPRDSRAQEQPRRRAAAADLRSARCTGPFRLFSGDQSFRVAGRRWRCSAGHARQPRAPASHRHARLLPADHRQVSADRGYLPALLPHSRRNRRGGRLGPDGAVIRAAPRGRWWPGRHPGTGGTGQQRRCPRSRCAWNQPRARHVRRTYRPVQPLLTVEPAVLQCAARRARVDPW